MARFNPESAERIFAKEFRNITHSFKQGDNQYSPKYYTLPSGGKAHRILMCGVFVECEDVGNDNVYYKVELADPTGKFKCFVGDDEDNVFNRKVLENIEESKTLMVYGKPDVDEFKGNEYVSVKYVDSVAPVEQKYYMKWVHETINCTKNRFMSYDEDWERAKNHYGNPREWRDMLFDVMSKLKN